MLFSCSNAELIGVVGFTYKFCTGTLLQVHGAEAVMQMKTTNATSPNRKQLRACLLALALPFAHGASAGGLYIQELADSHQGSANAGAQALGTDPSAIFHNPAALSQLPGRQLSIGGGAI